MQWLFTRKTKPPLDSSTSIPPTSEPPLSSTSEAPLSSISLLDKENTKITFSASLVSSTVSSTKSIPRLNCVSSATGNETQVAQNTHSGSIYKTGAGSKIPETREQKLARLKREALEFVAQQKQQDGSNPVGHIVEEMPIAHTSKTIVLKINNKIPFVDPKVSPRHNAPHSDTTLDPLGQLLTVDQLQNNAREEKKAKALAEAADRALEQERVRREEEAKALAEAEAKALEEERAKALAEAEKALEQEAEARALAEVAPIQNITPTDETDEEKQQRIKNQVLFEIIENNTKLGEEIFAKLWAALWDDFSSNQNYTTNDTTNTTNAISSNNTKDSTLENQNQNPNPPTREPTTSEKYTARLTPKTYFGVGIQTELAQEDNKSPYLNITQFYDDSGFESALKAQYLSIEAQGKNIKITEIECDLLDGNGKNAYTIDQIFENCGKNEMNFNLKLCAIFRNLNENELKLKFSIEGGLQDQDLNIKKSVFTKGENNEQYENIKTVIKQQTVIRQQNQAQPSEAISDPKNGGRPFDNKSSNPISISVVG